MNENKRVKTVKTAYGAEFEAMTDELIGKGYKMISAGYSLSDDHKRACWYGILVKEEAA